MEYDQYIPALPFYILMVAIHVLLYSFLIFKSQMINNGLGVN
jgi:hypothetical protein